MGGSVQEHRAAASSAMSQLDEQQAVMADLQEQAAKATSEAEALRQREAALEQQVTKLTGDAHQCPAHACQGARLLHVRMTWSYKMLNFTCYGLVPLVDN